MAMPVLVDDQIFLPGCVFISSGQISHKTENSLIPMHIAQIAVQCGKFCSFLFLLI